MNLKTTNEATNKAKKSKKPNPPGITNVALELLLTFTITTPKIALEANQNIRT